MMEFDDRYIFRIAKLSDIDAIMTFIRNEWKEDHILAQNRKFFEYEFCDDDHVNFIIAINREYEEIDGILGYLPASKDKEFLDIWGVMWKITDKRSTVPFLGVELMKRMINLTKCRTEIGIGANPKTSIPVLKMMLKFWIGKMKHFYRLSDNNIFKIANIKENYYLQPDLCKESCSLKCYDNINELMHDFNFEIRKSVRPYKDSWYINKRFFNHPIYKYKVYGVCSLKSKTEAIIIGREIICNDSKIFRIVDYLGDERFFAGLFDAFSELLMDYEYIDLYCYGLETKYITAAGFKEKDEKDQNIIPNYFEPFIQNNVDIWINSTDADCVFFKGDGDQDRPNFWN